MTRLGTASALIAVFAGGYAILMLINDQLTDFDVSAEVCAAALLGATLFEYVVWRSRKRLAHGRAAVWERRDRAASTTSPVRPDLAEDLIVNETMGALLPSGWSVRRASALMTASTRRTNLKGGDRLFVASRNLGIET
jgi:hypothetical protein